MKPDENKSKVTSVHLRHHEQTLLDSMVKKMGLPQSAVIRLAIRRLHDAVEAGWPKAAEERVNH